MVPNLSLSLSLSLCLFLCLSLPLSFFFSKGVPTKDMERLILMTMPLCIVIKILQPMLPTPHMVVVRVSFLLLCIGLSFCGFREVCQDCDRWEKWKNDRGCAPREAKTGDQCPLVLQHTSDVV